MIQKWAAQQLLHKWAAHQIVRVTCTIDSSKLDCTVDYSNYVILLTQLILHNVATQLTHFILQNVPAVDSSKLA